jgi:hypothetical protein
MLIAINRHLVDKADREQIKRYHSEFRECDLTAEQLQATVKKGYAFCAPFKQGRRKQANFAASGFLAVDVDRGLTIQAATSDPFFLSFASFLYTTPSHTEAAHRFRIVFELEKAIDDAETMRHALTGLVLRFGADQACTDACRIFFGSSRASIVTNGKVLPASRVGELVIRGQEARVRTDTRGSRSSSRPAIRSIVQLPENQVVTTEAGEQASLSDLPARTRIYCPQHIDDHPSAFVVRSQTGNPGLYCSSCAATFFLDDGSNRLIHTYRFDYGLRVLLDITQDEFETYSDDHGHFDLSEIRGYTIRELKTRYLLFDEPPLPSRAFSKKRKPRPLTNANFPELRERDAYDYDIPRLTLVRSPKGTGKTQWLESKVSQLKEGGARILLIGHRRSLIAASAKRLGLVCYLVESEETITDLNDWFEGKSADDDSDEDAPPNLVQSHASPTPHYAICADSLPLIMDTTVHRYDIVIIDEVEQVIGHLLSETMKPTRRLVLHALRFYLNHATEIYALDADLHRVSVVSLCEMLDEKPREARFIVNAWRPEDRSVDLYKSKHHLLGELQASVQRGERCFVCSNSKRLIKDLAEQFKGMPGNTLRVMSVTAENAHHSDVQSFLRDIQVQATDYNIILASPALGTGIDITFPNDEARIDTVFGIFEGRINTHFDIDQQLSRVRNPKRVCVWIHPQEYQFETDVNAIRSEIDAAGAEHRPFLRIDDDGNRQYHRDELYETVFAEVTAQHRASKNRLRHNFVELRKHNGWKVVEIPESNDLTMIGRALANEIKAQGDERRRQEILSADPIEYEEYQDLLAAAESYGIPEEKRASMRRYEIETFYKSDITPELLDLDTGGKLRDQVRLVELLDTADEVLARKDKDARDALAGDKPEHLRRKKLLVSLLGAAGVLTDANRISPIVVVELASLRPFAQLCLKEKVAVERLFDVPVRRDVLRKPAQQLGAILKLFGLSLKTDAIERRGSKKLYRYRVDPDSLAHVMSFVDRRRAWASALQCLETAEDERTDMPDMRENPIRSRVAAGKQEDREPSLLGAAGDRSQSP